MKIDNATLRTVLVVPLCNVSNFRLAKGQNRILSESNISLQAAIDDLSEVTNDILAETQSALGPYLSTAFG